MPQARSASTLVEKILARAAGRASVRPGEIVTARVDLAMIHDSGGPRRIWPQLKALGARLWDADRVVVVSDHYVPAVDPESARILKLTRDFVTEFGIRHFYDMRGISHIVLPEHGHLRPGLFVAGGDSHSTTGGAYGCYMAGFGASDMLGVLATGEVWTPVPETIRVRLEGGLGPCVTAKDIMLHLCRLLGMENAFKVIEYAGTTTAGLGMAERLVLSNMAAELGAETGLIGADATTLDAVRAGGGRIEADALSWKSDPEARFASDVLVDTRALAPQVAAPHSPANTDAVSACRGVAIDQAYIGACVGAKLEDLHMAARVLRGRMVADRTRLLVAPATAKIMSAAAADGTLATLTRAGAIVLPSGCGACAGLGAGVLAEGEVCISSTNRNFKGRMGHAGSFVYLASPYTVAAAAVAGMIVDPREVLA